MDTHRRTFHVKGRLGLTELVPKILEFQIFGVTIEIEYDIIEQQKYLVGLLLVDLMNYLGQIQNPIIELLWPILIFEKKE